MLDGARDFATREILAGGGCGSSLQTSSGGLCSTLKTLLMSSSYRVRSATARLITSLCSDSRFSEEPSTADENAAVCSGDGDGGGGGGRGGRKTGGLFFREVLIAAGATGNKHACSILWGWSTSSGLRGGFSVSGPCMPGQPSQVLVNRCRPRTRLSLCPAQCCAFASTTSWCLP